VVIASVVSSASANISLQCRSDKVKFSTEPVAYTGTSGGSKHRYGEAGGPGGSSRTTGASTSSPANMAKPNPWYPYHAVFNATRMS